jgi:Tfp pilus assembly protein PilV
MRPVRPISSTSRRPRFGGFTLAESLTASVVLALAVVGVSGALIASQSQSTAQQDDAIAISLGRQLMEEIAVLPIVLANGTGGNAGWPAVTNKANYDTTGDFDGYRDMITANYERERGATGSEDFSATAATPSTAVIAPAATPPALTYGQYRRQVAVTNPTFSVADTAGDFALVNVEVTSATGRHLRLSRLVAKTTFLR